MYCGWSTPTLHSSLVSFLSLVLSFSTEVSSRNRKFRPFNPTRNRFVSTTLKLLFYSFDFVPEGGDRKSDSKWICLNSFGDFSFIGISGFCRLRVCLIWMIELVIVFIQITSHMIVCLFIYLFILCGDIVVQFCNLNLSYLQWIGFLGIDFDQAYIEMRARVRAHLEWFWLFIYGAFGCSL